MTSVTGVTGVSFGYRAGEPILEGLDATFPAGAVSVIVGRSGRGKSTLLYLVGMLLSPWAGTVTVAGTRVDGLGDRERSALRAERVGFVFQDAALDASRTVADNVCEAAVYARRPRRWAYERAHQLLERFDVGLRADHRPGEVSGGQAQRVALCRALLLDPPVILADEPTGNLDADTAAVVLDTLTTSAHHRGVTVIIATHDPTIVNQADHVLHL